MEKTCLGQLLRLESEGGPLSACCSSRVATMEASTISISHGLWHCSLFLDTRFPAEKHQQNPTETREVCRLQEESTGKLVLYLEPKATMSCMDQPHRKYCEVSKDWGNRKMLGSPMEISNQTLLVHKSLLFPLCISKFKFRGKLHQSENARWIASTNSFTHYLNRGERKRDKLFWRENH